MLETIEELDECLCKYCYRTDYGERKGGSTPNGYWSCEGSFCEETYESYLDDYSAEHNCDITHNVIKYMTKVKLTNKECFE